MKKGVKTTLIVALSLFCAGVVISLAVSLAIGFDYSRLNVSGNLWGQTYITSENGTEREAVTEPKPVESSFKAEGQDFTLELVSSDVRIVPSEDNEIHIRYYENNWLWYDFSNENGKIRLVEQHPDNLLKKGSSGGLQFSINFGLLGIFGDSNGIFIGDDSENDRTNRVEIRLPAKHSGSFDISSVSGDIYIDNAGTGRISASTASGYIGISRIQRADGMSLQTVSGDIRLSEVLASGLKLETTSGDIKLDKTTSPRASAHTTSGDVELNMSEIDELIVNTVSGELEGTVPGDGDDYSVFFSSVSGSNSLSSHRGRGNKTIDFSSVSGDLDLNFSSGRSYNVEDDDDDFGYEYDD